ncbi:MAG: hypothetical protein LBU35_00525 [Holosporales bacterium]|jgi:hypothetical protein|nr:hypothetical protein [Holosporales bacterium]
MNKKTNTIALISLAIISANSFAAEGRHGGPDRSLVGPKRFANEIPTNHMLYESITMLATDAPRLRELSSAQESREIGFAIAHGFLDSKLGDRALDILANTGKAIYRGLSALGTWVSSKFRTTTPGPDAEAASESDGKTKGHGGGGAESKKREGGGDKYNFDIH